MIEDASLRVPWNRSLKCTLSMHCKREHRRFYYCSVLSDSLGVESNATRSGVTRLSSFAKHIAARKNAQRSLLHSLETLNEKFPSCTGAHRLLPLRTEVRSPMNSRRVLLFKRKSKKQYIEAFRASENREEAPIVLSRRDPGGTELREAPGLIYLFLCSPCLTGKRLLTTA